MQGLPAFLRPSVRNPSINWLRATSPSIDWSRARPSIRGPSINLLRPLMGPVPRELYSISEEVVGLMRSASERERERVCVCACVCV